MKKQRTNHIRTRDWAMVRIIQGVTKSGIHKDEKKDARKYACRGKEADIEDREVDTECQEEEPTGWPTGSV